MGYIKRLKHYINNPMTFWYMLFSTSSMITLRSFSYFSFRMSTPPSLVCSNLKSFSAMGGKTRSRI